MSDSCKHQFSIGGRGQCFKCLQFFMLTNTYGALRQHTIEDILKKTERIRSLKAEVHHVKCLRDMLPEENVIDRASLGSRISEIEAEIQDEHRS